MEKMMYLVPLFDSMDPELPEKVRKMKQKDVKIKIDCGRFDAQYALGMVLEYLVDKLGEDRTDLLVKRLQREYTSRKSGRIHEKWWTGGANNV